MFVQSSRKCNETRLLNVTDVGRGLSWLETLHDHGWVDGAESINYHLTFNRLDWINDNTDCFGVKHLLRLLRLNIST